MPVRLSPEQPRRTSPQSLQILDGLYPEEIVASVYQGLSAVPSLPPSLFWIPVASVHAWREGDLARADELRAYLGDFADFLFTHCATLLENIPQVGQDAVGCFEFWTRNVPGPQEKVWLHVDSTAATADWAKAAPSPIWGTILYAGPRGLVAGGGDTVFCTERPPPERVLDGCLTELTEAEAAALSTEWVRVSPKAGRVVVFEGSLAHYAAPVGVQPQGTPRVTLLVNLWERPPAYPEGLQGVCRLTLEEFHSFARLTAEEIEGLVGVLSKLDRAELERVLGALRRLL